MADSESGRNGEPAKLGLAVVGVGRWGPNLLRCFHEDTRCRVLYAVDGSASRLALVSEHYPAVVTTDSLAHALGDPGVDAIAIATPALTHFPICRKALSAGKHCFVEKPLTPSLEDAKELVAQAESQRLVLAVGHVFLYNPSVRTVKKYIDEGALGEISYLSMARTNLGPPDIDVDVAWDLASHDISIANFWLGTGPTRVTARGGAWVRPGQIDSVFATLEYPGGQLTHLIASWLNPRKVRDITVVGRKLMATIDDMSQGEPLRVYDKGLDASVPDEFVDTYAGFRASIRDGDVHIPKVPSTEPLKEEVADFVRAILAGGLPVSAGRAALPVVAAVEALHRSIAEERTVAVRQ